MSTLINPYLPLSGPSTGPSTDNHVHLEVPTLLEYRSEEDPDVEFIPKTVAGFGLGALVMGIGVDVSATMLQPHAAATPDAVFTQMVIRIVFMLGIIGVSSSLLLVGLKVRADRSKEPLYARHWLNSIGTGAAYALLVWIPWSLMDHSLPINRFVAAALLMLLTSLPILAARWTIGPHHHYSQG